MKLIGWAIALAAATMVPAAAHAQATTESPGTNSPQAQQEYKAVAPSVPTSGKGDPAAASTAPAVTQPAGGGDIAAPAETNAHPATPLATIAPTPGIGVPDGRRGLQEQVTPIGEEAAQFHNHWLLLLCVLISLFVLGLLTYTIVRYRRGAHPTPTRTSHNTVVEVVWTLVPVLILVAIAIPSIRLLRHQYSPPPADLTVKVIGNQWYWTYQYPDNGDIEIVSNILKEKRDVPAGQRFRTDADGPPILAVDERLVIPAGKVVKFIVTSNDVIHSFWIPAFWNKIDANPGQLNETWVKVDRPGVYFGQCTELCGARHAYMPIGVEVVPPARFAAWVASKGGTMPGARPQPAADSTGSSPVTAAANPAAAPAAAQPQAQPGTPANATPAKPTTAPAQGVTNNN